MSWYMTNLLLIFILLFITIEENQPERKQKAMELLVIVYVFTIFNDVLCLALFGDDNTHESRDQFALACACFT
eukprot:UN04762